jgi:lipid-binding SYLF domain-containing protein
LLWLATLAVAATFILAASRTAAAANKPEELVEKAALTIEKLLVDPHMQELPHYVQQSQAVLIVPQMVKGGFILGGEGGSGVLLVKGGDGTWSAPAFYTLAAGSIGLQAGGQVSEVVFTIMNEAAVQAILDNNFKLGADASLAVGPIGKGVEASTTTNFKKDVYAFSRTVGLFGGGSFEGAAILKRGEWNESYYATGAAPQEIVLERRYFNAHADRLRGALPN